MIGRSIAHYKVTTKIGEGSMGEVYRATDTKLGRDVALKVLPPAFAQDVQRMQRFQREAQLLAALNHPHIATIHGLEEAGSTRALVMELIEGPTLAERIARGPMHRILFGTWRDTRDLLAERRWHRRSPAADGKQK